MFKNQRVVIPKALRPEKVLRAHSSHQGAAACLWKARDLVFWPSMSKDIREAIEKCDVCAEYQPMNAQQPMQSHKLPSRTWSRLGCPHLRVN